MITVLGTKHLAHRLAWLYMTGSWPNSDIDHEDRDRSNNAWRNLRLATKQQNARNRTITSNNTSGVKGVSWDKEKQRFQARLGCSGKNIHVGYFSTLAEAATARHAAATEAYGEFANG